MSLFLRKKRVVVRINDGMTRTVTVREVFKAYIRGMFISLKVYRDKTRSKHRQDLEQQLGQLDVELKLALRESAWSKFCNSQIL